jgi:murein DD-endopeptidase MepM/ murein hydrolase activator NlpD
MAAIKVAPLASLTITGPFGVVRQTSSGAKPHMGVDLRARTPTEVRAPFAGKVVMSDDWADADDVDDKGGLELVIQGDDGWRAGFAHLSRIDVRVGDRVDAGDVIALTGTSGNGLLEGGVDPHLHMSLRNPAGELVDPMSEMPSGGGMLRVVVIVATLAGATFAAWKFGLPKLFKR